MSIQHILCLFLLLFLNVNTTLALQNPLLEDKKINKSTLPLKKIKDRGKQMQKDNAYQYPLNLQVNLNVQKMIMQITQETVQSAVSNHYELGGTKFDIKKGVYQVDCSEYVDHILQIATPTAYHAFKRQTHSLNPISRNYFAFFNILPPGKIHHDWYRVMKVTALKPGDILVFRYKNLIRRNSAGHVMIVMEHPHIQDEHSNVYLVKVADAAPSGHTNDTRPHHTSGIGIGTLLLKTNPQTGIPIAYAWALGTRWKHDMLYAMARPMLK